MGTWHADGTGASSAPWPTASPAWAPPNWGYEDVWREWYEADERIIVEIRERSWLKSTPDA